MEPYWSLIKQIIQESDVVLEILESRAVKASRNEEVERLIKESKRPVIFVINKADLVSREELEKAVDELKAEGKEDVVYVSNRRKVTIKNLLMQIRRVFAKYGKRAPIYAKNLSSDSKNYREAKADIVVGVVGYPNVGKSAIINALSFKKKAKVSSKAGTTHGIHWISAGNNIKFIDTPGVIPLKYIDETTLGMMGSKSPERLKDPDLTAAKIIELFMKKNKAKFEKFYNFKIADNLNSYEILEQMALAKGHLKKGGLADEMRTALIIVKDWQDGKLRL